MLPDHWITDWPIDPQFPLLTRANAGEVLPDPCSPLGWTLTWEPPGMLAGWRDSAVLDYGAVSADEMSEVHPQAVGHVGGYLYINATAVRLFGVRGPGLTPEAIDRVYLGDHPDAPPYVAEPWHDDAAATERLGAWMGQVMTTTDLPELRADQAVATAARASRPDLGALTDEQLVERARGFVPTIRQLFRRHLTVTAGSSIGPGVLAAVGEALGDPSLALTLITSVGDVDSAAPSRAMYDLSRIEDGADLDAGVDAFLHTYGSRGPNEWDIRSEVWETDPFLVRVLVDRMRAMGAESPDIRNERNTVLREQATARVRAALADDPDTLAQFESGLRSAHVFLAGRERAKTNVIKVLHEIRMALRELADRHEYTMSELCMLLDDELDAFLAGPDEMRPRLVAREEQYLQLFDLEPPFILDGAAPPLSQWARRGSEHVVPCVAGDVLTGVPGSPGVAEGRACVVLHPSDPFALEPGDVLVAPITDPAWTPLFVPAAAVVVNVGAQVSHAVIVSRELGIPCVVSVQHATTRIPHGALVRVDGSTGTVTLLDG
ncbi:MAG: PEP-utilizing enzyme [Ilumatobacteraceae bacterium]